MNQNNQPSKTTSSSSLLLYCVLGGGAWGSALANMLCYNNIPTKLYMRESSLVEQFNQTHINTKYLPRIKLHPQLTATSDISEALADATHIILTIPAQSLRAFILGNKKYIKPNIPLILCAKGIERESGLFMSQIMQQLMPENPVAVLSGPSFAIDVVNQIPTAVTLAAQDIELSQQLCEQISSNKFRCYASDDIIGAQIGGALKNVYAIASGAVEGYGFSESAKAALTTRCFTEMRRFGEYYKAKIETLCGLSGLGDLMLSCNSAKSRNFAYGFSIGSGQPTSGKLAEGTFTASIAAQIVKKNNIDAPIITAVHNLLSTSICLEDIIENLLARPLKIED